MITDVQITSRFRMEMLVKTHGMYSPGPLWHLISIHDNEPFVDEKSLKVLKQIGMQKHISLDFCDSEPKFFDSLKTKNTSKLFNEKHAEEIIGFVDDIQKGQDSVLVVHCQAGVSRSGAVGVFVCDYCRMDYGMFLRRNRQVQPNQYILNLLKRKANMLPIGCEQ